MTTTLERPATPAARHTSPVAAMVPVDQIRFHPRNIRRDLGDLRELTANIAAEGVLQPLLLHRKGSLLEVVDGHCRLAASRMAGLKKVPALIVDELDDDEAMTKMLGTTLKKDVTPAERRAAIHTLVTEFGHTYRGIAERLGVHEQTVRKWVADEVCIQRGRPMAKERRVPGSRVRELAERWEKRVGPEGLDVDEVTALLGELRGLVPGGNA